MEVILKWVGGLVIVLIAVAIGARYFMGTNDAPSHPTQLDGVEASVSGEVYELSPIVVTPGEHGEIIITGLVRNTSGETLTYVEVEFDLYDADGTPVSMTMDNTNDLAPGEQWHFEAIAPQAFDAYKLVNVKAVPETRDQ